MVHQLEEVNSSFGHVRQPEQEGNYANNQDEHLVAHEPTADPTREAVLDGGDDHFDDGELQQRRTDINIFENFLMGVGQAYLAVQRQAQQHEEEHGRPEVGGGHLGQGLRVDDEDQARAWKKLEM